MEIDKRSNLEHHVKEAVTLAIKLPRSQHVIHQRY